MDIGKYPRREDADCASDPEHNPWVREDCPACRGRGRRTEQPDSDTVELATCDACDGGGTSGRIVRCFPDDAPPIEVRLRPNGWTRCPVCGVSFSARDPNRWTGLRHVRCGQRLTLV